ncbi:MAG: hypothetical protein AB1716_18455 [Planctomycetota bacterium]
MMSTCETAVQPEIQHRVGEPTAESCRKLCCHLWMIDHYGSTVLRCHCLESSPMELRLRVPLGYGVGVGQRFEVRSHLPGQRPGPAFGMIGSAWVTIVEARILLDDDADHLEVRAVRDPLAA